MTNQPKQGHYRRGRLSFELASVCLYDGCESWIESILSEISE